MIKKVLFALFWLAVIFWLVIIFNFSAQDGTNSDIQSKGTIENVVIGISKLAVKVGIIKAPLTEIEMNQMVDHINPFIRKVAHATVYFILALLLLLALGTKRDNFAKNAFIAIALCFLYSLSDEFHQTFVAGRSGAITDCLIDTLGSFIACGVYRFGIFLHFSIVNPKIM